MLSLLPSSDIWMLAYMQTDSNGSAHLLTVSFLYLWCMCNLEKSRCITSLGWELKEHCGWRSCLDIWRACGRADPCSVQLVWTGRSETCTKPGSTLPPHFKQHFSEGDKEKAGGNGNWNQTVQLGQVFPGKTPFQMFCGWMLKAAVQSPAFLLVLYSCRTLVIK